MSEASPLGAISHQDHGPAIANTPWQRGKGPQQHIQAFLEDEPGHRQNLMTTICGGWRLIGPRTALGRIGQQFQATPGPHVLQSIQNTLGVGGHDIGTAVVHHAQPAPEVIHRLQTRIIAFRHHQVNRQIPGCCTTENVGFAEQRQHATWSLLSQELLEADIPQTPGAAHAEFQQPIDQAVVRAPAVGQTREAPSEGHAAAEA